LVPDVPPKVTYGKVPSSENNMPQWMVIRLTSLCTGP
jgi:hypothetical protein